MRGIINNGKRNERALSKVTDDTKVWVRELLQRNGDSDLLTDEERAPIKELTAQWMAGKLRVAGIKVCRQIIAQAIA